jgi:hypothetical protein
MRRPAKCATRRGDYRIAPIVGTELKRPEAARGDVDSERFGDSLTRLLRIDEFFAAAEQRTDSVRRTVGGAVYRFTKPSAKRKTARS